MLSNFCLHPLACFCLGAFVCGCVGPTPSGTEAWMGRTPAGLSQPAGAESQAAGLSSDPSVAHVVAHNGANWGGASEPEARLISAPGASHPLLR